MSIRSKEERVRERRLSVVESGRFAEDSLMKFPAGCRSIMKMPEGNGTMPGLSLLTKVQPEMSNPIAERKNSLSFIFVRFKIESLVHISSRRIARIVWSLRNRRACIIRKNLSHVDMLHVRSGIILCPGLVWHGSDVR